MSSGRLLREVRSAVSEVRQTAEHPGAFSGFDGWQGQKHTGALLANKLPPGEHQL